MIRAVPVSGRDLHPANNRADGGAEDGTTAGGRPIFRSTIKIGIENSGFSIDREQRVPIQQKKVATKSANGTGRL